MHGVSGHFYELIDYYYICSINGIRSAILLSDGTTKETFKRAVNDKYNFTPKELELILSNTVECYQPKIIIADNVCIVDGSHRIASCSIFAKNLFLLRCSDENFMFFSDHKTIERTHLLQDFKLYPERYEDLNIAVVDYVKKILWTKYKIPASVKTSTAMLYLTTNCRAIDIPEVQRIIDKQICDNYLIITNNPERYKDVASNTVTIEKAPIKNIFERFDTYVYTATDLQKDCSPRFIVECVIFGKDVVYEIDYVSAGIERRKEDMAENLGQLKLTSDDFFVQYVKEQMNEKNI